MTSFWNDLKSSVKSWGNVAAEKAEELGKVAATKTEELTKIGKVKLEIHQLQKDLEKNFIEFGRFVFDSSEKNVTNFSGNERFLDYIKKTQDISELINGKEKTIHRIRNDYSSEENIPKDDLTDEKIPATDESKDSEPE